MRGFWMAAAAAVLAGAVAGAGEKRVEASFMDGLYTITAPGEWDYEEDGDDGSVVFTSEKFPDCILTIAAPNTEVGDAGDYVALVMGLLAATFGEIEMGEPETAELAGYEVEAVHFTIATDDDDEDMQGLATVVNVDDEALVLMFAAAPEARAEAFLEIAASIMDSYELDEDALEERAEEITALSKKMNRELRKALKEAQED